jgi:hypothetical protein
VCWRSCVMRCADSIRCVLQISSSPGILKSSQYTSSATDACRSTLNDVWIPWKTRGSASVQCWSAWHMIATFSVRWKRSTSPLAPGWWATVRQSWIPHNLARKWKSCDSNWRPLLVVMVCGQPKQDIQTVKWARATVSAVMFGLGMTSGRRGKRSTAVRQYVHPADVGRGPTRSMWTWRKRDGGVLKSLKGVTARRETLERWPLGKPVARCDNLSLCLVTRNALRPAS